MQIVRSAVSLRLFKPCRFMFGHSKTTTYETLEHDDDPKYYRPQDHQNLKKPIFADKKIEGDSHSKLPDEKHDDHKKISHDSHDDHHVKTSDHHDTHKDHHDTHVDKHDAHHADDSHDHHHHHEKRSRPKVEYNTVSAMIDHSNLQTYFEVGPGYMTYPGVHYHGHHAGEYDWRTDPKYNKDIEIDPRDIGLTKVEDYVFPFEGRDDWGKYEPVDPRHHYSNTLVYRPDNQPVGGLPNSRRSPYWNPESDINHEYDYESEDYDYQTDNFRTQHFRKTGPIFPYVIAGFLPIIYFISEWLFQHFPDEDHWRLQRAPPLNFPDAEDTDDTETFKDYHSPEGKYLMDIGAIGPLWYDIKDGKKIYDRFAGVNPPMEDI